MTTDPRTTEERLRNHLDSNQAARERLCAQLLPLLGDYTSVRPRRPKGGPDGGRDIEALYRDELPVWIGVGFRNSVSDSPADKRWAKKKFKDDLRSALKENPKLKGFLFFTNVDLTPGEAEKLKEHAKKKGIVHTEVFNRERIRLVMDSPSGVGMRLQFLGLEMSSEEQVAFIQQLETTRARQHRDLYRKQQEIDEKLRRLEFLHACTRRANAIRFYLLLKKPMTAQELGHFRISIHLTSQSNFSTKLVVCARDAYCQSGSGDLVGFKSFVWCKDPDLEIRPGSIEVGRHLARIISGWTYLSGKGPFLRLGDFDRTMFGIFVTESLDPLIEEIGLVVDEYAVIRAPRGSFARGHEVGYGANIPKVDWPEQLSDTEQEEPWMQLYFRSANSQNQDLIPPMRHRSQLLFGRYTPVLSAFPAEGEPWTVIH